MQFNPEKMKALIKKASLNYLLDSVQLSFGPDKIISKMTSPNQDLIVSIDTQSNDVLMNGNETVKFNLYLNGGRSQNTLDKESRKTGLAISEKTKRSRGGTRVYYNKVFKSHRNEIDDRNVKITETENPAVRKLEFEMVDKTGTVIVGSKHHLTLVDDDHVSIRDITFEEEPECGEAFFTHDMNDEFLKLFSFKKKMRRAGIFYFVVKNNEISLQVLDKEGRENMRLPFSSITHENDFAVAFKYSELRTVLDVLTKDKEYKMQLYCYDSDEHTSAGILVRSKDDEEKYFIFGGKIVPADHRDQRLKNWDDLLPKLEPEHEIPEEWDYTESVEKTKGFVARWKNLSKKMLAELWTAKKILKKTPSERAQIMHGSYVGWMTWTQYCEDIGSSTQVVNRWLKRAFGDEQSNENPPEINESTNNERKLPDEYLKTVKKVMGKKFGREIGDAKRIFLNLQHKSEKERKEDIEKLMVKIDDKKTDEAVVLTTNNRTHAEYFKPLFDRVICFTNHKIEFEGNVKNTQGSCFVYFGENEKKFAEEFGQYGVVMKKMELED